MNNDNKNEKTKQNIKLANYINKGVDDGNISDDKIIELVLILLKNYTLSNEENEIMNDFAFKLSYKDGLYYRIIYAILSTGDVKTILNACVVFDYDLIFEIFGDVESLFVYLIYNDDMDIHLRKKYIDYFKEAYDLELNSVNNINAKILSYKKE